MENSAFDSKTICTSLENGAELFTPQSHSLENPFGNESIAQVAEARRNFFFRTSYFVRNAVMGDNDPQVLPTFTQTSVSGRDIRMACYWTCRVSW